MAIKRKIINYTVYPPQFNPEKHTCHDFRTVVKTRLQVSARSFGHELGGT